MLWVLVALGALTVALTYADYGATWDEGVQAKYGELSLEYFRTAGADTSSISFLDPSAAPSRAPNARGERRGTGKRLGNRG